MSENQRHSRKSSAQCASALAHTAKIRQIFQTRYTHEPKTRKNRKNGSLQGHHPTLTEQQTVPHRKDTQKLPTMFTTAQIFLHFALLGPIPFAHPLPPGTEWNCKCDLEQTNDPPTENANIHTPAPPLGLEGNPYHTHQLFTDRVSYIRHNTRQLGAQTAEYQAQSIVRTALKKAAKNSPLKGQTAQCTINGQQVQVNIDAFGLEHCSGDLFGKADYWLKNEILADIVKLLPKASCTGSMRSDNKHNTRRETVRRKTQTDWFYYLDLKLPNGNPIRIHVGHYKDTITEKDKAGKYYLYAITQKL